ncbi:HAMP domain-containing sensor histidine kinase [Mycobacterium sp. CPCC 205372]|uniref:histidine kinase n=1 Tax=Mycobacterium hippophais TaxID=3016340 RepID=A0ABT4PLH2_9MYCO|nr:HAMP domain-containing sensor histidine kinase [Mycobacterium hippophais]MCZ8377404.1 HAMP domain-containing sensor histidine kinase [Mycobacterium hippophais]
MDADDPRGVEPTRRSAAWMSLEGWPLRWKVAATLVVPVLLAAAFGALRIQNDLSAASRLSVATGNVAIVVPAVEFVDRLDALADAAASGAPTAEPLTRFDASATALTALVASAELDSAVAAELATASSTAKALRDDIAAGPVPQPSIAERAGEAAAEVASAVATITATVDDDAVRPLADRLVTVLAAQRALTAQQVLVAAPDFGTSVALRAEAAEAAGAEAAAIDRLAQVMPADQVAALRAPSDARRETYTRPPEAPVDALRFAAAMRDSAGGYHAMARQLAADLEGTVYARANALRSAALRDTAIILGAVLAALVFALAVGRSLIRSIGRLRRGAAHVAQVQLPEEIDRLSRGAAVPEIEALPVRTNEEIGQLARAIDDIHFQAVRLAGEHGIRLQIGDMFETLSRRSRSLVEEQLALIETLELDEDDPQRLDHLFRLDHLATRMRRNGDNLLVLADTVERHRRLEPVPLSEMLRAAMSEVEDYRRVRVGTVVEGAIVGAASGDVGHLIAELLDNALRYSPPESPVAVTVSRAVDAGILVEVADRGLGMPADDVHAANERLALGGEVTSETAKRMGLFVVGRLARRHGATVRLRTTAPSTDRPGVTASVHLPGALLAPPTDVAVGPDEPRVPVSAQDAPRLWSVERVPVPDHAAVSRTGVAAEDPAPANGAVRTGGTLPRRSPGASGVNDVASHPAGPPPPPAEEPPKPPPPAEPPWPSLESDGAPIFERMTSEWSMHRATPATPQAPPPTEVDAGDRAPVRYTESGLPIRERGAHLIPEPSAGGRDAAADGRSDPAAIRDVLSRQLAGVRRGRAESDAAERPTEEDR